MGEINTSLGPSALHGVRFGGDHRSVIVSSDSPLTLVAPYDLERVYRGVSC